MGVNNNLRASTFKQTHSHDAPLRTGKMEPQQLGELLRNAHRQLTELNYSSRKGIVISCSSISFNVNLGQESNIFILTHLDGAWGIKDRLTKDSYESMSKLGASYKQHIKAAHLPDTSVAKAPLETVAPPSKSFGVFNKAKGVILAPAHLNIPEGEMISGPDGKKYPVQTLEAHEEAQLLEALDEYFIMNDLLLEKKEGKKEGKETDDSDKKLHKNVVTIHSKPALNVKENQDKAMKRNNQLEKRLRDSENEANVQVAKKKDALKKEILDEETNKEHSKKRVGKKRLEQELIEQNAKNVTVHAGLMRHVKKV